jgi:hypothetical protein
MVTAVFIEQVAVSKMVRIVIEVYQATNTLLYGHYPGESGMRSIPVQAIIFFIIFLLWSYYVTTSLSFSLPVPASSPFHRHDRK